MHANDARVTSDSTCINSSTVFQVLCQSKSPIVMPSQTFGQFQIVVRIFAKYLMTFTICLKASKRFRNWQKYGFVIKKIELTCKVAHRRGFI